MATIFLTEFLFYRNGRPGVTQIVGNDTGTSEGRRVARYTFTAPGNGANREDLIFHIAGLSSGSHIPIRFYIGDDPDSHANAGPGYQYTGEITISDDQLLATGESDAILLPGKTYYLWVFPGSDAFGYYAWSRINYVSTITATGAAMSDVFALASTLGEDHKISLTRYSDKFTNRITVECGHNEVVVSDGSTEDSVLWVPPVSWASQNPDGVTVLAKITCTTYDGDIEIGKTFQNVLFEIPENVRPTVSFVLSDKKGYVGRYGGYVQNKSEVLVNATALGAYGSEIKECRIKCGEKETSGFSASFALPTAGSVPVSVSVTDTRGRTAESVSAVYVVAYSAPTVTIVDRYRSDENGNQVDDGSYAAVVFKANISPIYNRNSASYAVKYRAKGRTTWEVADADSYDGEYAPDNAVCIIPVNPDYAYEVCVEARDNLSTVESLYRVIQVAFYGFSYNKHTKAVGIGQKATEPGTCAFGIPAHFNDGIVAKEIGALPDLNTKNKDSLVAAINEVFESGGGVSPHIGANGNWFIGDTDTGVKAAGKDGITPHIGENGNWFIGSKDTGIPSRGGSAYVSPREYGAVGNGVTDDTAAFRSALSENRIVSVPGGTYKLSGELVIGDNCCLELSQDAVLEFTQTSGNCIVLGCSSVVKGNWATVNVPYAFNGNVVYSNSADSTIAEYRSTPPFKHWTPMWKSGRIVAELNICKAQNGNGLHQSLNGDCAGTAVLLTADGKDSAAYLSYMWSAKVNVRIAGAFTYGIRAVNINNGWNNDLQVRGYIDACEIGISLENCVGSVVSAFVQPRVSYSSTGVEKAYAKHGIQLIRSRAVNLIGSRVWDWDSTRSLWTNGGQWQHLALYGECKGLILDDFYYYEMPSYDIRSLIYTDTPANLEQMTILQEPITRWFKPNGGLPYFNNGDTESRLCLYDDLQGHFQTDRVSLFQDKLASAIGKDGAVLGGTGYIRNGTIWSTNGNLTTNAYNGCTGLIPCKQGDVIYADGLSFANADDTSRVIFFDSAFNYIVHVNRANLLVGTNYYVGYEETENGFKIEPWAGLTKAAYVAFNFRTANIGSKPMIAVNEEIKYRYSGFLADGIRVQASAIEGLKAFVSTIVDEKLGNTL